MIPVRKPTVQRQISIFDVEILLALAVLGRHGLVEVEGHQPPRLAEGYAGILPERMGFDVGVTGVTGALKQITDESY